MPAIAVARRSRTQLHERLEARLPEIEQTILTRAHSLADPDESGDPTYVEGLQAAISAGLRYGLSGIDSANAPPAEPIPPELVSQARLAARNGVSLETVLRRYFAGYTLLGDFVIQEAKRGAFEPEEFQRLLRTQAELFDRLIAVVSEEYRREAERAARSSEQRRAECVARLLGGEFTDTARLDYDLDAWHVGAIVVGPGAESAIRDAAGVLDRRLLSLDRGGGTVWAWMGGIRRVDPDDVEDLLASRWPPQVSLALGEPARGLAGWRLTHRQASAALPVVLRTPQPLIRYANVALLASMFQDDLLAASLHQIYIAPLERERDGGATLRETLRAYFAAERNATAAAAALGVTRQTITNRLGVVEGHLGRPLSTHAAEIEAALRLEELDDLGAMPTQKTTGFIYTP